MSRPLSPTSAADMQELQKNFDNWRKKMGKPTSENIDQFREIATLLNEIKISEKKKLGEAIGKLKQENGHLKERIRKLQTSSISMVEANDPEQVKMLYKRLRDDVQNGVFGELGPDQLEVLKKCYEFCREKAKEQVEQLRRLTNAGNSGKEGKQAWLEESVDDELRRGMAHLAVPNLEKEFRAWGNLQGKEGEDDFIDNCVHICWLLVLQNPIWFLEFDQKKNKGMFVEKQPDQEMFVFPALVEEGKNFCLVKGCYINKKSEHVDHGNTKNKSEHGNQGDKDPPNKRSID